MREWVGPSINAGTADALQKQTAPLLIVAGTADLRVPAEEEARRIARDAPPRCLPRLHLVEGAGHAGGIVSAAVDGLCAAGRVGAFVEVG